MITLCLTEAIRLAFLNAGFVTRGASGMIDLPLPGEIAILGPHHHPGLRARRAPALLLSRREPC